MGVKNIHTIIEPYYFSVIFLKQKNHANKKEHKLAFRTIKIINQLQWKMFLAIDLLAKWKFGTKNILLVIVYNIYIKIKKSREFIDPVTRTRH